MSILSRYINFGVYLFVIGIALSGCSSSRPYTRGPIKTFDPDNKNIPLPAESEEHFTWETLYYSTFYQLEKPLDLGQSFQQVGHSLGISDDDEAENVNVLDEVPNSSWYTRRHYFDPMSIEELKQGPNVAQGPDTTQTITVIRGKSEGVTPGFTVRDAQGDTYVIKVDYPVTPEQKSSSEVIGTLIYYAAGYHTPQNSISYFDPDQLVVGEDATVTKQGEKQKMTAADLDTIISKSYARDDGKIRVLASKYIEGRPLGPWKFLGTRQDDPNDRIPHQDRREVRGLRVLASWLNDTDRRTANTMASYVEEGDKKYIRHYLLDMGSTLGAWGNELRLTKRGQEYRYDLRYMGLSYITLGLYEKPWAKPEAADRPMYPEVGYYEAQLFDPGNWVTSYPNPAFEKVTTRDGFWGAKMVMAFSDEDIEAVVEAGQITNTEAEEYLIEIMKVRRDKIGRYWFKKVNPLDKFEAELTDNKLILSFSDLGVDGKLYQASEMSYRYSVGIKKHWLLNNKIAGSSSIEIDLKSAELDEINQDDIMKFRIFSLKDGKVHPDKKIDVYVLMQNNGARVVGLDRED